MINIFTNSKIFSKTRNLLIGFILAGTGAYAQQLAFPGAEGFGRFAKGGRGGKVYEVTSLADSGPGTLREAVDAYPGEPLTIVFKVGGIINLQSEIKIKRSNLTIAGQTAPGDGICLKGHSFMINGARAISQGGNHGNIIIRYIRSRPGSTISTGIYGFDMENCQNVIVDHCSFSWANEECAAMYDTKNVTVQWSIISEGLYNAGHAKGLRSYGGVWGGQFASYHHNLIANQNSRAIRFNGARAHDTIALIDYRNNVIYNSGSANAAYGGEVEIPGGESKVNMVNNYYKPGPAASALNFISASYNESISQGTGQWHIAGNYMKGNAAVSADNWLAVDLAAIPSANRAQAKSATAFDVNGADINTQTAQAAYESVLLQAGAILPVRDAVDARMVSETATGTASVKGTTSGKYGIIDAPAEVGGWPVYNTASAAEDKDHDGMADSWEIAQGLDPDNADDRNNLNGEGYTMLEVYLNAMAPTQTSTPMLQGFAVIAKSGSETAAEVKWATLGENNLQKFEIERSADNLSFSKIGDISPLNQSQITEYLFTDNSALGNTSYYRLKITDNNNAVTYSNTASFYRAVAQAYWTEPFTSTSITSIPAPATVQNSVQDNGTWILYGAGKEERSITNADPNNQWASGSANPSLKILNNNTETRASYSLVDPPYIITPVFSQGVSKITFNELLRGTISANSILVYTSTDGGATWSSTGISNLAKSSLFDLVTVNINNSSVNRLKITKPAGVTMNIDNLTVYGPVGVTLPLQFLSFNAKQTGLSKVVHLDWSTASEVNTLNFIVERSNDGRNFYEVARVSAKNQSGKQTYSATDPEPVTGLAYYRLRQNDTDGKYQYYEKVISVENQSEKQLAVFPNPAQKVVKIQFNAVWTKGTLTVYSLTGAALRTVQIPSGATQLAIDVSDLASGVYTLLVQLEGLTTAKKFVKN